MQDFERDPLFKMDDIHDISKEELRERTMEKVLLCSFFIHYNTGRLTTVIYNSFAV